MKMKMKKVRGQRGTSRPKSAKRNVSVKGQWKAVELDPGLFSEEGLEGLVCFEELTSYRLVDDNTAATAEKDLKKDKKRKVSEEVEGGEETEDTSEPAKKKAKKKKRRKKLTAEEPVREENICEDVTQKEDESPEPDPPKCVKPKAKKKKKNKEKGNTEDQPSSTEPEAEAPVEEEDQRRKAADKKQVKNWTRAALSGSGEKTTDLSAWKDLFVPAAVLKALSALGFASPTPIQALVLPPAIRDRMDILGAAETGSGKTLAFGIPIIHSILEWRRSPEEPAEDHTDSKVESLYLTGAAEPSSEGEEAESDAEDPDGAGEDELMEEAEGDEGDGSLGCVKVTEEAELDSGRRGQPLLGLVLTPTRELAVQVKHHIDAAAKFTDIRTALVVGGMAAEKQRRMLKRRPEIVIATPGRLWDLIQEKHPHLLHLRQLRCLVIDEADRMVERGHFSELESLLEMLNTSHFNPKRQTFVFSATLTLNHSLPARVLQKKKKNLQQKNKVELLMEKVGIKSKPKVIDLSRKEATAETLTETQICCQKDEKDFFLYYFLLQHPGRTMVFANSIDCIKRLNALLVILDLCPLPMHANMHQKQRLKNLERFAERDSCVLLTTDVAARGLDIPDVQHVIHYQVPRTSETYVHRSGRTARATKEGLSLLLIGPDDMLNFKKIYRTLGKDEELPVFPLDTKCMEAIKERVNLARSIEKIEFFNTRQKQHNSWFKQAAAAMDVDLDEGLLLGGSRDENADREQQMMVKGMKKHLKHLISQPVFKKVMRTKYPTQMGKLSLLLSSVSGGGSALARVHDQQTTQKTSGDAPAQQRKKTWRQRKKMKKKQQQQQQQQDASEKV